MARRDSKIARTKGGRDARLAIIRLSRIDLLCAGLVFFVALTLYAGTLAPTVTLIDSGELIVVARSLGVAHPPGFPLWVMLAHLASLVPFGNIASRINFSSALFGALASAVLTLVVIELLGALSHLEISKKRRKKSPHAERSGAGGGERTDDLGRDRLLILAPALGAGLFLAFSRTLWSYATVAEVYALNTLLIVIIFCLLLRWRRCTIVGKSFEGAEAGALVPTARASRSDLFLYAAAILFGVALGVHHVTVVLILPALAVIVYRTEGLAFFKSSRLVYAAIFSTAAFLAVYAYLPLAASRGPIINWGEPNTLKAIWRHITGRQYQSFLSFEPKIMGDQFIEFVRLALREFGLPWLPVATLLVIAGIGSTFKRDRTAFWFLCALIGANLAYALNYSVAEDKDAYYLTTFVSLAIAAGVGLRRVIQFILARSNGTGWANLLAALLVLFTPLIALVNNWSFNNRRNYLIAHDYVENIFSSIEPNGLLLTFDWQVASPMFYAQEIEQRRLDVKIVDIHLLRRSWYFDYLRRAHPDLVGRSREKIDAFVFELKQWEQDEQAYAANALLAQRISSKFEEMIQSFVEKEMQIATVSVTLDFLSPQERDRKITSTVIEKYGLVPQGIVFKLVRDRAKFHNPRRVPIETRGLTDGTLNFEKDDVVRTKVFPVYPLMLVNRGRYLALFGQHHHAIDAFNEALKLDPNLGIARRRLEESMGKLQNP